MALEAPMMNRWIDFIVSQEYGRDDGNNGISDNDICSKGNTWECNKLC